MNLYVQNMISIWISYMYVMQMIYDASYHLFLKCFLHLNIFFLFIA